MVPCQSAQKEDKNEKEEHTDILTNKLSHGKTLNMLYWKKIEFSLTG
jgi:hypothetical protein